MAARARSGRRGCGRGRAEPEWPSIGALLLRWSLRGPQVSFGRDQAAHGVGLLDSPPHPQRSTRRRDAPRRGSAPEDEIARQIHRSLLPSRTTCPWARGCGVCLAAENIGWRLLRLHRLAAGSSAWRSPRSGHASEPACTWRRPRESLQAEAGGGRSCSARSAPDERGTL